MKNWEKSLDQIAQAGYPFCGVEDWKKDEDDNVG
jgi:hypothetical protein